MQEKIHIRQRNSREFKAFLHERKGKNLREKHKQNHKGDKTIHKHDFIEHKGTKPKGRTEKTKDLHPFSMLKKPNSHLFKEKHKT